MFNLMLKDLLVQKKTLLMALVYSVFVLGIFNKAASGFVSYGMGTIAIGYIFFANACSYDEKNKSDIVLNSLPIRRSQIVLARYLAVFTFAVIGLAMIGILGAVMKLAGLPFPGRYIGLLDITGSLAALMLMASCYLPLYYKFGYIKTRLIIMFMFMLLFFLPGLLIDFAKAHFTREQLTQVIIRIQDLPAGPVALALLAIVLGITAISIAISQYVYRRREF